MKIIKKTIWSLFLISNICFGQNLLSDLSIIEQKARVLNDLKYSVNGIDGHQYFLDDWGNGKIIINDSVNAPQARIQYNMVSGDPIIGSSGKAKSGFILRDKSVTGFVINNTIFTRIESDKFIEEVERNYFVVPVLSKDNYLLIDYSKILKEPYVLNNGYNNTELNKKYVTLKKFYILNKDKKYLNVKLKEKYILKELSDKKSALKKYIKQQDLNLKKEKDVVKLLTYYHSL